MKLTILTTITNPEERQDAWFEALGCYGELADETIVVNGGKLLAWDRLGAFNKAKRKLRYIDLPWPYEWNWIELPKHLNAGLEKATGDWVLKLDIDQLIHEKDFKAVRQNLQLCPKDCDVATFQKMSMTYGKKYYQKGGQPIAFRNKPYIRIGENQDEKTDLCFAIHWVGNREVAGYQLPVGTNLKTWKTGISYWNYDYFFKTQDFTRKEFHRFSRAYKRFFGIYKFGETEEESFQIFLRMMKGRHDKAPYTYKLESHPKWIREKVKNLKPEQFGYNAWGLL